MNRAEKRRQKKLLKQAIAGGAPLQTITLAPENLTLTIQQAIELGAEHHKAGRIAEAESIYQQILRVDPNQPDPMHLIGVIAHQVGRHDIAAELINKSLGLNPNNAEAHSNLGNAYSKLGRFENAIECHLSALSLKPEFVEAHNNLGGVYNDIQRYDDAVTSYQKALALNPGYAAAQNNLGNTFHKQNKLQEAFNCHVEAIRLEPSNDAYWNGLATTVENFKFSSITADLLSMLLEMLARPTVQPSYVVTPILSAIRLHPDFAQVLAQMNSENAETDIVFADVAQKLSGIPLLLKIMVLNPLFDLELERGFTALRQTMLMATIAGKTDDNGLPFSTALALQCFTNEYLFTESDTEKATISQLEQQIATLVDDKQPVPPAFLTALGAYRPLYYFPWAQSLNKLSWPAEITELIRRQISEPLIERALRSQFSQLTPIDNTVSQSVRDQYEENPYPRWIESSSARDGRPIGSIIQTAAFGAELRDYTSPSQPEILIAGCGTGKHILYSNSLYSNPRILAVDLSLTSLSYAKRKMEELGFAKIEYGQADIMELGSIDRQFDLIESVGVLHHLGDPVAGWQVLVDLLRPEGMMKIGLYSEIARQDVVAARSMIASGEYTSSIDDIRQCRQDIISQAIGGNLDMLTLLNRGDFFSLSNCRDLIFHVQEHRFTLPQLEKALETLNLKFLGFHIRDPNTGQKFSEAHPGHEAKTSLSHWHQFELENPKTFTSMYQFWCQKM